MVRITRKVSQTLGLGKIKTVEPEEAMMNRDITVNTICMRIIARKISHLFLLQQTDYEMLFVSMKFEPMFIKEYLTMKWHCQNGLIENIHKVVEEYRIQRELTVESSGENP